jgi:hypothetical protein
MQEKRVKGRKIRGREENIKDYIYKNIQIHPSIKSNKGQRAARIFLSSTFVDMHDERETIMRRVMVELDQYCYERQVSLTYIDMRWGMRERYILRKRVREQKAQKAHVRKRKREREREKEKEEINIILRDYG